MLTSYMELFLRQKQQIIIWFTRSSLYSIRGGVQIIGVILLGRFMGTYQEGLQCFSKLRSVFCLLWTEDSSNVKREVTLKLRFESARSAALVNGI